MTDHIMLSTNLATSALIAPGLSTARSVPSRSLGSPLWDITGRAPSLDLNLAQNKNLLDSVTGQSLVTFTRASTGTYIGADGLIKTAAVNEARFDHNPTTGESLGLLVEEQRQNLNTNSEAFDTYTTSAGSVSANQGVAPNGTSTADEITSTGGGVFKSISGTTASTSYTVSVFAKYISGGGIFSFGFDANPSSGRADFDLQVGALGGVVGANVTSRSITPYGNGWYRCSVTATVTSTSTVVVFYSATSGAKWLCWGAQLEAGAFPASYIPTTTSAATRSADVASITGAAFSSWYRQDEGTFYGDAQTEFAVTAFPVIVDGRTSSTDIVQVGYVTEPLSVGYVRAGNADQAVMYNTGLSGVRRRRVACGMAANNFGVATNGGSIASDSSGTMPTNIASVFLGSVGGSSSLNGAIRRLTYWPARLANSTLQSITA